VPDDLPSESFHVGIRASNLDGADIDSFIVHVGVNKVVYIGPDEDVKSFHDAFAAWKSPGNTLRDPGTTFVVRKGDYKGPDWQIGLTRAGAIQSLPAGTPSKYTTLMAEDPGSVRLYDGAGISGQGNLGDVAYWSVKGFFIDGGTLGVDGSGCSGNVECQPHHIKFIQNGVHLTHTGSSLGAGHANYILFENNFAYGGHRVKFLAYKTKKSIFRRNVARFDHNQEHTGPKNTFAFYTSTDILAQNNIAIDADQKEFIASGELAGEFGCPTTAGESSAEWDRNINLNSDMLHANLDLQNGKCHAMIRDVVAWDNRSRGSFVMTRSPSLFDHATFGDIKPEDPPIVIFNGWPGQEARGIINSVIHDVGAGPLFEGFNKGSTKNAEGQSVPRYGVDTVNLTGFNHQMKLSNSDINNSTITDFNPIWTTSNPKGGLRYLVRIESNSNLTGKAKDGGDLGANVLTFKGKSGTLWGDDGYQDETDIPTWPFPYQEEIADKMRSMTYEGPTWKGSWENRTPGPKSTLSGDRGFAETQTNLTDYIWGYLGSTVPPMNVAAAASAESAVIRWDPPAARANIKGYKVYDYNPKTKSISNGRDAGETNSFTIGNLTNSQKYHFAVTAVDTSSGESSYSYPVEVTPQERPKPMPPTATKGS